MNKTLLKLAVLALCFSIIDWLVLVFLRMMCEQTQSPFYCTTVAPAVVPTPFSEILFIISLPATALLGLSLIILVFSKWYKGNISVAVKSIIVIIALIIFVVPYGPFFSFYLLPNEYPKTYQDFQNWIEQRKIEIEKEKEKRCGEYKQKRISEPMQVPPFSECN